MNTEMEAVRVHVVSSDVPAPKIPGPLQCVRSIFRTYTLEPGERIDFCAATNMPRRITLVNASADFAFVSGIATGNVDTANPGEIDACILPQGTGVIVESTGALSLICDVSAAAKVLIGATMEYFQ